MSMKLACLIPLMALVYSPVARSAFILSVDMDTAAPGIQFARTVSAGESFNVGIILTMTAPTTLSSYAFTARYDTNELNYNAAASSTSPPAGLFVLSNGNNVAVAGNDADFGAATLEQIQAISAGSFAGGGNNGPLNGVQIATLNFTANAPSSETAGIVDIKPGFYTVFDGAFDNSMPNGMPITGAQFEGGTIAVVPEPSSAGLLVALGAVMALRRYARRIIYLLDTNTCVERLRNRIMGHPDYQRNQVITR